MKKILFLVFLFLNILEAKLIILDTYEYKSDTISELSGLAYDGKTLYAISDYGVLHHFNIDLKNDKINSIKLIKSYPLKNKRAKRLKKKKRDSESVVYKNHNLYISFEIEPRVEKYSLDGIKIKKIKIPKVLRDIDNYKGKNKALESLAYSKKYGFLTAPERPFKDDNIHTIYSTKGKTFNFKASGYITDITFINKDNILVLERDWNNFTRKFLITLKKVSLTQCKKLCKSKTLKTLESEKDNFVDNYEGLTKIKKNLYLMVSDDNNNIFEKTYFVLFKITNF